MLKLMDMLAAYCKLARREAPNRCGAFYLDLASPLPPDEPRPAPIKSKLKLVG